LPKTIQPGAALAVVPRPNQAFWTLSAVWSGWLWGREAVQPLRGALERRRYDWQWHAGALHHSLSVLKKNSAPQMPVFLICPELVPGFASAVMAAANAAGYRLSGQAVRNDVETAQILLEDRGNNNPSDGIGMEDECRVSVSEVLKLRNEPCPYLTLHLAALVGLERSGGLPINTPEIAWDTLTKIQNLLNRVFNKSGMLVRSGSQAQSSDSGWWWLSQELTTGELPLSDRVELEIVRSLMRQPNISIRHLDALLCKQFPGWLTPDWAWIEACLESYAIKDGSGKWRLSELELPQKRKQDLTQVEAELESLANKLFFKFHGVNPWNWEDSEGAIQYRFYGLASSMIARHVLTGPGPDSVRKVLVIPGSRIKLLLLKLRQDARLEESLQGWHILKFRHLKNMAARSEMSREIFENMLDSDPMSNEGLQDRML
jgi:hypothetical protein